MEFILASASPRRQELLSRIVKNFEVIVSEFDEDKIQFSGDVDEYVKTLAEFKAKEVAQKIEKPSIIIAADTVVVMDNTILGKPKDKNEAFSTLKMLSGKCHRVYTAIAVYNSETRVLKKKCLFTEVYFSDITENEIWQYIESGEPLDKAGSYGIQGLGGVFVEKINGCYYNVVGLPLNLLKKTINEVL